jgi:hypothetical protein
MSIKALQAHDPFQAEQVRHVKLQSLRACKTRQDKLLRVVQRSVYFQDYLTLINFKRREIRQQGQSQGEILQSRGFAFTKSDIPEQIKTNTTLTSLLLPLRDVRRICRNARSTLSAVSLEAACINGM